MKIMPCYRNTGLCCLFLVAAMCLFARTARCDGISFGETIVNYELDQLAVIACGQDRETMVLGTTFFGEGPLENQVWIVPVFSSTPPVVEAVEGDFLQEFAHFLDMNGSRVRAAMRASRNVVVHEEKQVGIYDLAVLEPASVDALVYWLDQHGYHVPYDAQPLLSEYVNKGAYFIANRIDLANVYEREVQNLVNADAEFSGAGREARAHMVYRFASAISQFISGPNTNADYEDISFSTVFSRQEFTDFIQIATRYQDARDVNTSTQQVYYKLLYEAEAKAQYRFPRLEISHYLESGNYSESPFYQRITEEEFIAIAKAWQAYRAANGTLAEAAEEMYAQQSALNEKLTSYWDLGDLLHSKISTPIKISFQPEQCFFPLKISSGAPEGEMKIAVAVFGNGPLRDRNNVLTMQWSANSSGLLDSIAIPVTSEKIPFQSFFNAGELDAFDTITLIVNKTTPSQLTDDAVFVPAGDQGALFFELDYGNNLVGNPFTEPLCASEFQHADQAFYIYDSDADNPWLTKPCLDSCEAGFLKARARSQKYIEKPYVDLTGCENAFKGKTGWRLVARPDFFPSARIGSGPFSLNNHGYDYSIRHSRGEYRMDKSPIIGRGYWIFIEQQD